MTPNGIYPLTIVAAEPCPEGIRIAFDVDLEDERTIQTFSLAPPAACLRSMLEACGKTVPHRRVRLNLDKLIGLECMGMVIGGQAIEFFPIAAAEHRPDQWKFIMAGLEQVPNYIM